MGAGLLLGRLFGAGREVSLLVSSGTAICGGSAIAAVGSAVGAASASMAVATGAIFVLNAVGLYLLPVIGHALEMTDAQFGTWAGIALHDISSVAGAGKAYNPGIDASALETAMIVKLTRVLWILPIALLARWWWKRGEEQSGGGAVAFPWFILLFLVASAVNTFVPRVEEVSGFVLKAAGAGFQGALFLIGAGISGQALAQVGWRALVTAVLLWVLVAGASLPAALNSR
jgi:uncharacterized integral membrane protein (TIGR00698 family)